MKLEAVIKAARRINPDAKLHIESVSPSGTLSLSATGLTAEQAKHIGLGGLVMGVNAKGVTVAIGDIETGHARKPSTPSKGGNNGLNAGQIGASSLGSFVTDSHRDRPVSGWHGNGKTGEFSTTRTTGSYYGFHHLKVEKQDGVATYNLYYKANKNRPAFIAVVRGDNLNAMEVKYANGKPVKSPGSVKTIVKEFVEYQNAELKAIKDGVSLAAGINKDIAEKIGAKYAKLAKDLEAGIQGKYIRNVQDAEKTYEQLTKGLNKKLKAQDKAAIVTWLKMIDAEQYARNARVLGKVFTGVDWAIKGADLVNAAIEGFSTGNWKAFRNQLEALGLSIGAGYTLSAIAAFFAPTLVSSTVGIFAFAYLFGWATSYIDAERAGELEKWVADL
ncbi:colicin-like pore-forming protein [Serratia surfactantfaciens]|uniref:colicin-like pore-forming protein n=1 Tax=Serratia TaxID=613 RepID=UPI001FD38555|nr:colicin-like pore-forming protein [Serratia surfactantfaciens]